MKETSVKLPGLRSNLVPPDGADERGFVRSVLERLLGISLPAFADGEVFYSVKLPDGWRVGNPGGDFRRGLISSGGHFLVSIHDMGKDSKLVFEMRYRAILFFGNFRTSEDLKNDPDFHSGEYGRQRVTWVIKDTKRGDIIYPPSGEMLVLETSREELDAQRVKVQATVDGMNRDWLASWEL
jgi:hypothetical protein